MRRLLAVAVASALALLPAPVRAASAWGSPDYGDPPGWCTDLSDMWVATVVTNDPMVGTNPELETYYGFHPNPGYDDWYGYFYGDFRGVAGDESGWMRILHEDYPRHYHWNFGDFGWAVHGHAKQYIAYYNWTFGGRCGFGRRGAPAPPPYMADQYGYPVVDIYVDAMAPYVPAPYAAAVTPESITFTWDPVADRGDGAGRDFFVAGIDHYVSWITLDAHPAQLQLGSSAQPRVIAVTGLKAGDTACVHVEAVDRVQNVSPVGQSCAAPLAQPPMPAWSAAPAVFANPAKVGLVGLDTWFWLAPGAAPLNVTEGPYVITAEPSSVEWDFGDGTTATIEAPGGFGEPYPERSSVAHVFAAHDQAGYTVRARVTYTVVWSEVAGGRTFGPYPLGSVSVEAAPLVYPVEQAQPELVAT